MDLSAKFYTVALIDGDYAHLKLISEDPTINGDEVLVARALLPETINEGTKLKWEMLQYEVVD